MTERTAVVPTYQYACTACQHRFEAVQKFTDSSLTECPECTGKLRKLYSSVGVVFKGSGFYRTDSRSGAKTTAGTSSSDGGSSGGGSSDSGSGSGSSGSGSSDSGKSAESKPAAKTPSSASTPSSTAAKAS